MKHLIIVIISWCLVACASNENKVPETNPNEHVFELDIEKKKISTRSFSELVKESGALNQYIGSYPPRFKNERQREKIYTHWLTLVSDAEAYAISTSDKEKSYYILAELYRQGHNMDVKNSAVKAKENLDSCLSLIPKSTQCNFSASYFYLSVGPQYLSQAEKSLSILRDHFHPSLNSEVESGYVFLYLFQRDVDKLNLQIDKYLKNFSTGGRTKMFTELKANLGNEIELKHH